MLGSLSASFINHLSPFLTPKPDLGTPNSCRVRISASSQGLARSASGGRGGKRGGNQGSGDRGGQRVWRRRKLTKKNAMFDQSVERVPFLEERARKINDCGALLAADISRLLLSEDNRYAFVNEVAAEAKEYVEKNRDAYGHKKAILHVLSNRMNEAGFERDEAYLEIDPYKPGPGFLIEIET